MKNLFRWWGHADVTRVDTHVYFSGYIKYQWRDDKKEYSIPFCPSCEIAVECFQELVKRHVISKVDQVLPPDGDFFSEECYKELSDYVDKVAPVVFTTDEEFQPRKDLFFQVNVNLIRSNDILFDILFLGYKYPFENILMPVEVFHEFVDRLEPRLRLNTIHGARKMKLFIAHASENKTFARKLSDDLVSRGFLVWFDEWEIKVGDSIVQKINDGINSSSYMIVVLSKDSVTKPWVKEEMSAGFVKGLESKGVYLLPALFEKCQLPALLKDKKYADFSANYDDGLSEILSSI